MFRNLKLRQVLLCLGLQVIALFGVPVKAEEIEDLLRKQQEIKLECVMREDDASD